MTYRENVLEFDQRTLEFRELNESDKRELEILSRILAMGPSGLTVYDLEKELKMPHATCHKIIKNAAKEELLEVASKTVFRTGLNSCHYFLTKKGFQYLHSYLTGNDKSFRAIDQLVEKNPGFHPLFKWWPMFRRGGQYTTKLLFKSLNDAGPDFPTVLLGAFNSNELSCEYAVHQRFVMDYWGKLKKDERKALRKDLIALIRSEPELQEEILRCVYNWEFDYQTAYDDLQGIKQELKALYHDQANLPAGLKTLSEEYLNEYLKAYLASLSDEELKENLKWFKPFANRVIRAAAEAEKGPKI